MMKKIILSVVAVIVLFLVFTGFNKNNSDNKNTESNNTITENVNQENNVSSNNSAPAVGSDDSGTVSDPEIGDTNELNKPSIGLYAKYDGNISQYDGNNIILFFKANWCPSCRALDSDIKNSLNDIPENVVLLELNYDTETELKKKYGITTQHTLVQVDKDGNMIKKWSGGNKLEDVINQIN